MSRILFQFFKATVPLKITEDYWQNAVAPVVAKMLVFKVVENDTPTLSLDLDFPGTVTDDYVGTVLR